MYRNVIYESYSETLERDMSFKKLKTERNSIYKYFKKNYLPYFPKSQAAKILDLGCGLGSYVIAAKKCGYQDVIGIDGSQSCADFCNANGVNCICEDALTWLNKHTNEYDVIMFNDVIEHFTKDEAISVTKALNSALVEGGVVLIKTDNMANPFTAIGGRYMDLTHEFCYNEMSMKQLLFATGFSEVTIKGTDIYVVLFPLNLIAKISEKVISAIIYLFNCLYGRTTIKIFQKDILAIAQK